MTTTTKCTHAVKAKKPVFPIRPLFLLMQKFHLLVIDGEAFAIKGKEHKHIRQADYKALLSLAWITPMHVIAEGLFSHEVTPLGQSIAAQIEEQNSHYQQLRFDLSELEKVEQVAILDTPQTETEQPATDQAVTLDMPQTETEQPTTTSQVGKRPNYQSEEAKAARAAKHAAVQKDMQQAVSTLLAEIKAGKSEHLLNYLKFASKFHQYSPLNQILIAGQAPHATRVAGYSTWKKQGYQVKKGEKGITIIAPRPYGKAIMKNEETGEESITYLGVTFTFAYVFDASQLEARPDKPVPIFFTPLADDQEALYTAIAKAVQKDGITFEIGETGRAQGYSTGGKIRLQAGLDSTNHILTLIHEWAHEKLHHNPQGHELTTNKRELHAEAISFVVAHHYSIHNPFSSDYLQNWGNNERALLAELDTIKTTASTIIEQIEAE